MECQDLLGTTIADDSPWQVVEFECSLLEEPLVEAADTPDRGDPRMVRGRLRSEFAYGGPAN
ncbi:MAG: hypothetical protein OEV76_08700 [Anaerolineae bacterium]|nr:hypothetical protein [Anaerolineae bacterium]